MTISALFLMLTVALLVFRRTMTTLWNQFSFDRSNVAVLVVLLLLLFVMEPETRAFLAVVDYIGADIFLLLLFLQGREILVWSGRAVWQAAFHALETWSWWPLPLPNWALFKQYPGWSLLAVAQALVVTFMGTLIVVGVAVSFPRL